MVFDLFVFAVVFVMFIVGADVLLLALQETAMKDLVTHSNFLDLIFRGSFTHPPCPGDGKEAVS